MNQVETLKTPIKSEGDKKDYRLVKLPNGLKALLIQTHEDTSSNKDKLAAASLTVGAGSLDEPSNVGGLAHFLEHMLFMGSEKYPEEEGFGNFIGANGGSYNAMTDHEHTVYYFEVFENALTEALDRHTDMLIKPLLLRNALQREREAVDSEFQMAMRKDAWREEAFLKVFVNENHPGSFFDYGDLQSLKNDITDDELYVAVREFFKKYVANNMFMSIQSSRSLDELQKLVVDNFSSIQSGPIQIRAHQDDKVDEIFKSNFYAKIHFMKPRTDRKVLIITWKFNSVHPHSKCNPLTYVNKIFSNESDGGISSFLKEAKLANSTEFEISSASFKDNSMFALAQLVVNLTDRLENIDPVLEAIFSYLLMIKETSIEEHRRLYDDHKEIQERKFNVHKETDPYLNVYRASIRMKYHKNADILREIGLLRTFDEEIVSDIIDAMNQRNFNLTIVSDKHEKFPNKMKYFGIEYDEVDFPEAYQKLWDERKSNPKFHLERSNPLKSSNFEIFIIKEESTKFPVKILDDDIFEVWHKLDEKFNKPIVHMNLNIMSPKFMTSSYNALLLEFYIKVSEFVLAKRTYEATSAGLNVSWSSTKNGLKVSFDGYNEKLPKLVDIVTKTVETIADDFDKTNFEALRADFKKKLSTSLGLVSNLKKECFNDTLKLNYWSKYDFYKDIDKITLEEIQKFQQNFFQQLKIQMLVEGNMTKTQTEEVVAMLRENFSAQPIDYDFDLKGRGYQLPEENSALRTKSLLKDDENSFTEIFYQAGPRTIKQYSMLNLLDALLTRNAHTMLRSKSQLGYSVGTSVVDFNDILGFSVYVESQENKNSHAVVQEKMEAFMTTEASKFIENLNDEEFETYRQARMKILQADDLDLAAEFSKHWDEIVSGDFMFDRKALLVKATNELTKVEIQEFFKEITQQNVRKLTIQVIGDSQHDSSSDDLALQFLSEKFSDTENVVTDIETFHNGFLYPVVKVVYQ